MSTQLRIVVSITSDNKQQLLAEVLPGGDLPADIFIYENTGTDSLGEYQGVCGIDDYSRMQTFTGESIPKFGNKYVKYTQAKILLDINDDATGAKTVIAQGVKALSISLKAVVSNTQIINIP